MAEIGEIFAARRRFRPLRTVLAACLVSDGIVALTSVALFIAFRDAPNNGSVQPADDGNYFLAGIAYALSSGVRDLLLVALVIMFLHWRAVGSRLRTPPRRRSWLWAASLAATISLDVVVTFVGSASDDPTAVWVAWKVAACVVNAAFCLTAIIKAPGEVMPAAAEPR